MLFPPDLNYAAALELWRLSQHLPSKYTAGEDQKKSYHLSARPLVLCHVPGYCVRFIKRLDEGPRLQLLGQKILCGQYI